MSLQSLLSLGLPKIMQGLIDFHVLIVYILYNQYLVFFMLFGWNGLGVTFWEMLTVGVYTLLGGKCSIFCNCHFFHTDFSNSKSNSIECLCYCTKYLIILALSIMTTSTISIRDFGNVKYPHIQFNTILSLGEKML